jgi:hypothetical protein
VYYHQPDIFDWLTNSYTVNQSDHWLLENCVLATWFYGLLYCYEKGITKTMSLALEHASVIQNNAIFRLLLLFVDLEVPPDFTVILLNIIQTGDFQMTQLILGLIVHSNFFSNAKSRMQIPMSTFRYDCLLCAIETHRIDFVNLIWEPLEIDKLMLNLPPYRRALIDTIEQSNDRAIIQKFLKYGNIFQGISCVFDWLDSLAEKEKIDVIDMVTNGEKDYFKHCPRNPLPYARGIETARYLLEHGADPNYRGADGLSLLHRAIRDNDQEMKKLVKQYGGTVTQHEESVLHPVHSRC